MERRVMIWLLCFTAILLKIVDALTTYVAGTTSPYFQELNPFMAQLHLKYGVASIIPYATNIICSSVAVICMTVWGVLMSYKHRLIEPITYYGLFAINIGGAYIAWWNTIQLLLFGR